MNGVQLSAKVKQISTGYGTARTVPTGTYRNHLVPPWSGTRSRCSSQPSKRASKVNALACLHMCTINAARLR